MFAHAHVCRSRPLGLLFLCFVFVLILTPSVASQDDDTAVNRQLSLQIDAPKGEFAVGDEALVTLTATNPGGIVVEAVTLHLHDQPGMAWSEEFKSTWLELGDLPPGESRVIEGRVRVTGLPAAGVLPLFATLHGYDTTPAEANAQLTMPPPPPEEVAVSQEGSLVDTAGGRVQFAFPADWHESDAQLTFQLQEQLPQAAGETGRLLLFSVEATAGAGPIDSFDAAATVTVDLNGLVDPAWAAEHPPAVSTRESEKENWTAVESEFDPKTGLLTFTTTHFSSYQVVTEPQIWKLVYNPPGASPYTGAATYQYSIELPPGIGGLTPDLTLNYGSRSGDGMRYPAMAQGFGVGWSLPQAYINNGNTGYMYTVEEACCRDFGNYNFTLVLNGVSYYLKAQNTTAPRHYGTYQAMGGPELKIEYVKDNDNKPEDNTDNVTGEFWRVRTADGTTYTFGRTADAEQVIWPINTAAARNGGQARNPAFSAYNWKLNSIVDVHSNKIEYVYETACGLQFSGGGQRGQNVGGVFQCTEVDTAVEQIRYNFSGATAQTVVAFDNSLLNEGPQRMEESMTAGVFRPNGIDITQAGSSAPTVSSYDFTYVAGAHYFSAWDVSTDFWELTSVIRRGSSGAALPTQTFTYEWNTDTCEGSACVKLLTKVNNGYGAVTTLGYTRLNGSRWTYVSSVDTWDGVAAKYGGSTRPQTRLKYTPSTGLDANNAAQVCYDEVYHQTTNPCHSRVWPGEGSGALIGFDFTTVETQRPVTPGGNDWETLSKSKLTFYNDDYWLLGQTQKQQRYNGGTLLDEDVYVWNSPNGDAQLNSETHTIWDGANPLLNHTVYTYDAAYGAVAKKEESEKRQKSDPDPTLYRCTQYVYAHLTTGTNWLVNRPIRETLYEGTCATANKRAETLYRYAGSANPNDTVLDPRALLTYVLRLRNTSNNYYATEKRTYTPQGLLQDSIAFGSHSTLTTYATNAFSTTSTTYNGLGLPSAVTTTATGLATQTTTVEYDNTFPWLPDKVTDSNGVYTQYSYDPFGRLSRVALPGDALTAAGATMTYAYADGLAPWKVETSYKNTIRSAERIYYDGLGRPVQTQTDDAGVYDNGTSSSKDLVTTLAYDARGLEVCRTVPFSVAAGANTFNTALCGDKDNTTTVYDALSRPLSVTTPDDVVSEMSYGVAANITVDGRKLLYRTSVYDGNEHLVNRFSDAFGRQVLVREFTGNSPATHTAYADTRYSYDVLGNLTAVGASATSDSPPGEWLRLTTMSYDALGRKLTMDDPDAGRWAYAYDGAGNLARQENKSTAGNVLQATCYYYDKLNRLSRRINDDNLTNGCPLLADAPIDGANHLASYTYDTAAYGIGQPATTLWGPVPNDNNDVFTYDAEGRLVKQAREVNGQAFTYEVLAYDTLDRPTQVKLPSGEVVATTYDKEGANTLKAGSTNLIDNVGYNERGQLAFLERTGAAPETTLSYHGATENFRLSGITNSGSSSFPDFAYTGYDAIGNLTALAITDNTGLDPACNGTASECSTFSYDEMNRLTAAKLLGAGAANYDITYEYNQLGNIRSRMAPDPNWSMEYTYGTIGGTPPITGGPQALTQSSNGNGTVVRYDYDERGNMDGRYVGTTLVHNYIFDVENRLTSVTTNNQTMTFAYDADGQRVLTTRHDGTKVYAPFPDYEVEVPTTGATTTRTTYRIAGQMVAVQTKVGAATGTFYYPLTDHLGNMVALSTTGGTLVTGSVARFDPFGNYRTLPLTNPGTTNHGFTGHRHNNTGVYPTLNVGLIYMNARYYLPEVGRFISADTIVPNPFNPQSFNRYSYGLNSPLNYSDPSGHRECNQQTLDCSDPIPHPTTGALVIFAGDWPEDEKATFTSGSEQTAQSWFEVADYEYHTPREVFLSVFGNPVLVEKVDMNCATAFNEPTWDCYGSADGDTITVYRDAEGHIADNEMWAMHEIFHAFNANAGGQPYADLEANPILIGGNVISPTGGNPRTLNGYQEGGGFLGDRTPYVNSWDDDSVGEDFADMGSNWAANSFASDVYGNARFRWMDVRMRMWIDLAVDQN